MLTCCHIPDSRYMFLSLLLGGQCLLGNDELDYEKHENRRRLRIISFAQDLMYTTNGDKFLTPKHVSPGRSRHESLKNTGVNAQQRCSGPSKSSKG